MKYQASLATIIILTFLFVSSFIDRYTLLVGRPPFETSCLKDTYLRIRNNEYAIPSKVSRPAAKLIQKFLSERPQDRPRLDCVLNDEFFTRGFFPRSLPSICCVAPPKFTSLKNRNAASSQQHNHHSNKLASTTSSKSSRSYVRNQVGDFELLSEIAEKSFVKKISTLYFKPALFLLLYLRLTKENLEK